MEAALEAAPFTVAGEEPTELDLGQPWGSDGPSRSAGTAGRMNAAEAGVLSGVEAEMAIPEAVDPGALPREGLPLEPTAPNQADYIGVLVVCGLVLCLCVSAIVSQPDLRTTIVIGAFSLILVALAAGHHVQYRHDVAAHAAKRQSAEAGRSAIHQVP